MGVKAVPCFQFISGGQTFYSKVGVALLAATYSSRINETNVPVYGEPKSYEEHARAHKNGG